MNVTYLLAGILMLGMALFRLAQARRAWRDRRPHEYADILLAPFGEAAVRGAARAVAAQVVILSRPGGSDGNDAAR
jgi:hypothetical protein